MTDQAGQIVDLVRQVGRRRGPVWIAYHDMVPEHEDDESASTIWCRTASDTPFTPFAEACDIDLLVGCIARDLSERGALSVLHGWDVDSTYMFSILAPDGRFGGEKQSPHPLIAALQAWLEAIDLFDLPDQGVA